MTESEIQCLKDNIDQLVQIETRDGELLTARVLSVFHDEEFEEHEFFYHLVSSNKPYKNLACAGGYALNFDQVLSVKIAPKPEN